AERSKFAPVFGFYGIAGMLTPTKSTNALQLYWPGPGFFASESMSMAAKLGDSIAKQANANGSGDWYLERAHGYSGLRQPKEALWAHVQAVRNSSSKWTDSQRARLLDEIAPMYRAVNDWDDRDVLTLFQIYRELDP